ncbi:STAS domain-containing protein [Streptomyces sp. NRRL S-118]|uniref:STAS domain-containing protein n=1 Tax=Streptomyces sp. NRRL S-118 TaxID=1463881 RepID=UPI00099BD994|nr:STAS domain-containing protein [Streptomyces sp. NRRL S-118]
MDTTDPKVFRVVGVIEPGDVPRLCEELGGLLAGQPRAGVPVECDVGGVTRPNLALLDALARLRLTAQRLGHPLTVRNAPPALCALLELTGLGAVLMPPAAPEGRTGGTSAARPGTT